MTNAVRTEQYIKAIAPQLLMKLCLMSVSCVADSINGSSQSVTWSYVV